MSNNTDKINVAVIGSGNIGSDLMIKLTRSKYLEFKALIGIDPESKGLARARELGFIGEHRGLEGFLEHHADEDVDIFFDATSAGAHIKNAEQIRKIGKKAIDMTPAAIGPFVVPAANMKEHLQADNINLVTCGGQATVPIVYAINRVTPVRYAEIVSTVSSRSAGPGTRVNIDEFTTTTAKALSVVGGAKEGKAIIILNPADPPILMRNTVRTLVKEPEKFEEIIESINQMVEYIQSYVPGYHLRSKPTINDDEVTVFIEVEGAGDFLPKYAGNLDIMTSAGVKVAEEFAKDLLEKKSN